MDFESQLQLLTSSPALCQVICFTSPPFNDITYTSAFPYCLPENATHFPSGETRGEVSYPCMAVRRVAWPSFTLAFQRSPSNEKITVWPSGVKQGFDKK